MPENKFEILQQTFTKCTPFFRDTWLPNNALNQYKVGLFLREPTFCDATYKLGGFVAPHRFLIISSNARCLEVKVFKVIDHIKRLVRMLISSNARSQNETPRGLCVWIPGRVFKVIDHIERANHIQITLLEIPENLLDFFCATDLNELEQGFVIQSRATFEQCIEMAPLPELNTNEWRERLMCPIGINDQGAYFPLFSEDPLQDDKTAIIIRDVLHHQAQIHLLTNDYSEALPLLRRALAVIPKSDGIVEATPHILLTLAKLYFDINDLQTSEATLLEAFAAFKQIPYEENRLGVAATHSLLGHVYQTRGALFEAEQNYLHALKIKRRVGNRKSLATLLTSLGALYEKMKRFDDAKTSFNEAFKIECDEMGECHNEILLNNIGRLAYAQGEYAKATDYIRRALEVERNKSTSGLDQQATLLYNLAESFSASGNYDKSLETFKEALDIDRYLINEVISITSERQRQEFLTDRQFRVHQCISLILNFFSESQPALEFVVKLIFERKSIGLDITARHRDYLLNSPSKASKLQELREIRSRIALKTFGRTCVTENDDIQSSIEEEIVRCELLESELSTDIQSIAMDRRHRSSGWHDVIDQLPEQTVLIEFFRLTFFDFTSTKTHKGERQQIYKYIAVILDKSRNRPKIVDIGDADEIDKQVAELRLGITGEKGSSVRKHNSGETDSSRGLHFGATTGTEITVKSGEVLRRLIFDPLVPDLQQRTRIIISPDGNLCRLPFEILPLSDETLLIDRYEISYLTSGSDLLRLPRESPESHPLVIADPDYNMSDLEISNATPEDFPSPFSRLGGIREEGRLVAQMLGVEMISGKEATEKVIKECCSPTILHLATHGFVLEYTTKYMSSEKFEVGMTVTSDKPIIAVTTNDTEPESLSVVTPPRMMSVKEDKNFIRLSGKGLSNPMLRSGIALAGANSWLRGQQLPDETEDGILTAEEVTDLNLTGTELVVLSACETGLGEILSGEGVLGLRRSFVLAGAKTLVISLWKVPDVQTKELMIEFYSRLIEGEACSMALRNAQLVLKKRYPDPFYWGAFICQGAAGPISKKLKIKN